MKKLRYAVVTIQRVATQKEARALADQSSGSTQIIKVSPHDERCPKGADHAHASYDGATFCSSCGQYLSVQIERRL